MRADPQGLIAMNAAIVCDELETWANDLEDNLDPADRTVTEDEMVRWYPRQQEMLRATRNRLLDIVSKLRTDVVERLEGERSD